LYVSKEILASMIATVHNLGFYMWLVKEARKKIGEGTFAGWKNVIVKQLMQRL
jgi:queuine tRNA-ribosyltransferase